MRKRSLFTVIDSGRGNEMHRIPETCTYERKCLRCGIRIGRRSRLTQHGRPKREGKAETLFSQ